MYDLKLTPSARRDLKRLDIPVQKKIVNALERLAENPLSSHSEKLSGVDRLWRMRVGDYRIVYTMDEDLRLIVVAIIRHRKEVYRDLSKIDAKTIVNLLKIIDLKKR